MKGLVVTLETVKTARRVRLLLLLQFDNFEELIKDL